MFHPDGIEVYLKPAGDRNDKVKIAEFPLPESDTIAGDERNRRCAVLARSGGLKVVVRLSPEFKLHSASALVYITTLDSMAATSWNVTNIQRSRAHEQLETTKIDESDREKSAKREIIQRVSMTKAYQGRRF